MKIVYEIDKLSTGGGLQRILTDRINYMAENWGWDITIITLTEERCMPYYPLSPKVTLINLGVKSRGWFMCIVCLWKLNKIVKHIKPDFYVTFQTIGALSCLLRTHKTTTIYEAHVTRAYMQHSLAINIAERFSNILVVLGKRHAEDYPRARHIAIIPNFTLLNPILMPNYDSHIVVSVGRRRFEKNFERLETLWDNINKSYPDWQLKIHHNTSDITSAYLEGSIYVMTSLCEAFPMVLLECMSCGLPVIAFDCPHGPREIIEDGKTGFLIPYDDDALFIKKLTFLMDNPKEREKMGRAAKESVKRFDKEKIMEQWKDLLTIQ